MRAIETGSVSFFVALYAALACGGRLDVKGSERGTGGRDAGGVLENGGANGGATIVGTNGSSGSTAYGGATGTSGAGPSGTGGHTPWMGNPSVCPATAPGDRSACGVPEGSVCGYYTKDPSTGYAIYSACACRAVSNTSLVWDCYDNAGGAIVCPATEPANGASCFGFKGSQCDYPPRTQCTCDPNDPATKWACADPNPVLPGPSASLDGTTAVRDLSDAERRTFCEWYVTGFEGPGFPAPPDVPPDADGMSGNTGCRYDSHLACQAKYPGGLPVSFCVGNLALSTCAAPLSELIDCAVTLYNQCWPSPRGCGPYLDSPGCSGTLIMKSSGGFWGSGGAGGLGAGGFGSFEDCRIRVE